MEEPTKILFVIDRFKGPTAGTEGQLYQLVKNLDRACYRPHLLVFDESDYLKRFGFPCDYTVLGCSRLSSPKTWVSLRQAALRLSREGYTLAHVFFNDPSIICPPVFSSVGIRTIISRRDMGYWYTPLTKILLRHTQRYVSCALVNSNAVKEVTSRTEKIPLEKIHVIYNGYDDEVLSQAAPEPVEALAELKSRGFVVAGLVANIRPLKRIGDAIRALGSISSQCPRLHLAVIGAGDPAELKSLAAQFGVFERVHFLGARSDVKRCLEYLDIGILCSESEGFSNAIVEYLYAGLPVICTNVGGNPEAVIEGKTGFLYEVGDIGGLAERLHQLVSDPSRLARMAEAARADAQSRFSLGRMIAEHEACYQALVGTLGPSSSISPELEGS